MELVLDANILFAALIKDAKTAELLLYPKLELYIPEYALNEFAKHEKYILRKTKRTKEDFEEILAILKKVVKIIPKEEFRGLIKEAEKICPDKYDTDYFALALKLNVPIWSNDKKLKQQSRVKIYSTKEILELL